MNPLDDIIEKYEFTLNAMISAAHLLPQHRLATPEYSRFISMTPDEIQSELGTAINDIEESAIISLIFKFEPLITEKAKTGLESRISRETDKLNISLYDYARKNLKRIPFKNKLAVFSDKVNGEMIEEIVDLYDFRNWVVHGKKGDKNPTPNPHIVYDLLTKFLIKSKILKII